MGAVFRPKKARERITQILDLRTAGRHCFGIDAAGDGRGIMPTTKTAAWHGVYVPHEPPRRSPLAVRDAHYRHQVTEEAEDEAPQRPVNAILPAGLVHQPDKLEARLWMNAGRCRSVDPAARKRRQCVIRTLKAPEHAAMVPSRSRSKPSGSISKTMHPVPADLKRA
jgi:hypothetical protein